MIRSTRLADLVNIMDPKLVAAAFGLEPQAILNYPWDHIDGTPHVSEGRLPDLNSGQGS
ncbi:hypothetical protein [Streptomyces sp. NPDC004685]